MSVVGVLPHGVKPEARELAPKIVAWLRDRGHDVRLVPEDARAFGLEDCATPREAFAGLDLLVVLGGDGTVLHGIELAGFAGVPVLGVNLGSLGFLTEAGPDDALRALERTLAGDRTLDERSTVAARIVRRDDEIDLGLGINEVSVERNVGGKAIRMSVTISGQRFVTVAADGLIVATPTGSTAYAFSMRGPIVDPQLRALIVVAVGAHSLFDRPIVCAPDDEVRVEIARGGGIVVLDGKPKTELRPGDALLARVGVPTVRLVRLGPDSYFTRVARRFGLPLELEGASTPDRLGQPHVGGLGGGAPQP